ncbi:MAG: ATP-binding protein [Betaproteobacteria bacterium]|nr:ATP-binding protein [Betaproteobacteria bacterium]
MMRKFADMPSRPLRFRLIGYLIILLLIQGIIAYGALLVFDSLPPELTGSPVSHSLPYRDAMRGTVQLMREKMQHSGRTDEEALDQIRPYFSYPMAFVSAETTLPASVQKQLAHDDLAVDESQFIFYVALSPNRLLKIGPIIEPGTFEPDAMAILVLLLVWSVLSALIFFGLWHMAMAPLWRDAFSIRDTAESLAQGNLKARTGTVNTWLFKPLAGVLNDMAVKIEKQVSNIKVMSHAVSHELRTPLARLRFSVSMLDEMASNPERQAQYIEEINRDIAELESLINVSLDYFRMEQHKIVLHRVETSLKQWGEALCAGLIPLKPSHFRLVFHGEDMMVYFDSQIAGIAVKNLLLNAFKYASSQVELRVDKLPGGGILIEVDDDGPGIPESAYDEVFTPFARLDNSRTRATGGYGLGLSYVKLIAEQHHGSTQVKSSPLGGAKFIIHLDIEDEPLDTA